MSDEQALKRPIGWWLKEADARLNAAFDAALDGTGVDRRGWQVLTSLSKGPTLRTELVTSLGAFDPPATINEVIDHLLTQEWAQESAGVVSLTEAGTRQQNALAPLVAGVRQQVTGAVTQDDYVTLVRLLAQLVAALPPTP